ncbi:SLC13 family permease [Desulfovibrio subterraneus]|uniref:SLC13 family permease n=1 Tax=Desulfovibrio subterraneus TaxID=2718620 RepID=UPI0022B88448|nr:SLC13 family permease [Desulfovibrio subterraneus]WBF66452.1 SLC13 family permease [Desulfovibrio subterraneus]
MKRLIPILGLALMLVLVVAGVCFAADAPPDPTKAYLTLGILAVAAVLFFTEIVPLPVTAMLVPIALSIFKIVDAKAAFSNFGNVWVIIFMAMFIVGEATFVTGFADKVGKATVRMAGGSEKRLLVLSVAVIGILSAFLSNTGTTVVAIPMIIGMCASAGIRPSKILMPVAFASSLGGTITLVGTPPNGIINSMLQKMGPAGIQPFGFFEFGLFGVPLLIMGVIFYATIGSKMLPNTQAECTLDEQAAPKVQRPEKMWWALGIFIFVVAAMASEFLPLVTAAMLGACLVVITGCMTMREAFKAIDWTTIFLFAGMLSMSTAMDKSGAASLIAKNVVSHVSDPYALLAVCCALTAIITNFMSNTATAALMAPLAIPIAVQSGISPLPLAMGIAMSASACFLTPVATPPNTIVLGPGNYNFMHYVKAGWPLQIITFIMCVVLIPMIWPF